MNRENNTDGVIGRFTFQRTSGEVGFIKKRVMSTLGIAIESASILGCTGIWILLSFISFGAVFRQLVGWKIIIVMMVVMVVCHRQWCTVRILLTFLYNTVFNQMKMKIVVEN